MRADIEELNAWIEQQLARGPEQYGEPVKLSRAMKDNDLVSIVDVIHILSGGANKRKRCQNEWSKLEGGLGQYYTRHSLGHGKLSCVTTLEGFVDDILPHLPAGLVSAEAPVGYSVFKKATKVDKGKGKAVILEESFRTRRDNSVPSVLGAIDEIVSSEERSPPGPSCLPYQGLVQQSDPDLLEALSFNGATIRRTPDGSFSVYDVIDAISDTTNARKTWADIQLKEPTIVTKSYADNGKLTPVADIRNIFRILNFVPGRKAAAFRAQKSDSFLRVLGADQRLIDELVSRRQAMDQDASHPHHVFDQAVQQIAAERTPQIIYPTLQIKPAIGNTMVDSAQSHWYAGQPGTNCGIDARALADPNRPFAIVKAGVSLGVNNRSAQHARSYQGFEVLDRIACPADSPAEMLIKRFLKEKGFLLNAHVDGKESKETETFLVHNQEEYDSILMEVSDLIRHCSASQETEALKIERVRAEQERERSRGKEAEANMKAQEARSQEAQLNLKKYELASRHCPDILRELLLK